MHLESRATAETIERYTRSGDWIGAPFHALLRDRAARNPDRVAIVDRRRRVTYGELFAMVERTAAKLASAGIAAGDVVTIQLPNRVEFAAVFFALERIGAIANQISLDFRAREVEHILGFCESAAYVCAQDFRGFAYPPMVSALAPRLPHLRRICVVDGDGGDAVSLAAAIDGREALPELSAAPIDPNAIYRLAFTSGTTGNPKAVAHSQNTTLSACRTLNRDMAVGADDVFLVYLPLGLNWGFSTLAQALIAGATAVLLDRFAAAEALALIEQEKVSYIATAPASLMALLDAPDIGRRNLSSLRVVVSGGAACPVETIRRFRHAAKASFIELYGMLETGYHTYTRLGDDPERVSGTVGRPPAELGLRLIDADGKDVADGCEGEIAAQGPSVHLGYQKNPAANAQLFTPDGWFRTGDLGAIDAAGNLRIVGRNKEMINRGGKKFHPREIEEILYRHPKVAQAAMIGVPDARLGESNCLCVVPRAGENVTLADVLALLGDVAAYKLPERLELFDSLPLTPTGKLQRHALLWRVLERGRDDMKTGVE